MRESRTRIRPATDEEFERAQIGTVPQLQIARLWKATRKRERKKKSGVFRLYLKEQDEKRRSARDAGPISDTAAPVPMTSSTDAPAPTDV